MARPLKSDDENEDTGKGVRPETAAGRTPEAQHSASITQAGPRSAGERSRCQHGGESLRRARGSAGDESTCTFRPAGSAPSMAVMEHATEQVADAIRESRARPAASRRKALERVDPRKPGSSSASSTAFLQINMNRAFGARKLRPPGISPMGTHAGSFPLLERGPVAQRRLSESDVSATLADRPSFAPIVSRSEHRTASWTTSRRPRSSARCSTTALALLSPRSARQ